MSQPARSVFATCLCLLAPLLAGCHAGPQQTASTSGDQAPLAFGPRGTEPIRAGRPASELPAPVAIDAPASARQFTDAVLIDTRAFPEPIQVRNPWDGPIDRVKNHLPTHSRDKSLTSLDAEPLPEGEFGGTPRATPTGIGFPGIAQTPWSPPDPTIAVGPNHIVQTVNDSIAFFTKSGQMQFSAPLGQRGNPGFFEGQGAGSFTFDPKCFYDPTTGRFVVHVLEVYSPTEAWIDIAVSDDSDPNGVWHRYRTFAVVDIGGTTYWVDYPGLGYDDNAIYVAGNLFKLEGPGPGFAGPIVRVFDKAPLLTGQPASYMDLVPQTDGSMQVAQTHGIAPRTFMVTRAADNALRVWTVNDPLGSASIQSVVVPHLGNSRAPNADAPNLDGGLLDTLDGRLMNAHWRDGVLHTAHAIRTTGDRTRVRWYEVATNGWPDSGQDPALVQQGNITSAGTYWFFPAIATDKFGRVGMVMARSAADEYASVWVTGREPDDAPNTMSTPSFMATGDRGSDGRWGDYFDIAVDPNDDRTFWVVGQYAKSFGWQTWIGSFVSGCPGDENGDGRVDFFDISAFLGSFNDQSPAADIAPPFGTIDFFDISAFLLRYAEGCPD